MQENTKVRISLEDYFLSGEDMPQSFQVTAERTSAYLHICVAQSQPVSFVQFGCVLQDFHDGQQVAAVLCPFIGGESQA